MIIGTIIKYVNYVESLCKVVFFCHRLNNTADDRNQINSNEEVHTKIIYLTYIYLIWTGCALTHLSSEGYCNGGKSACKGPFSTDFTCDCPPGKKGPRCEENDYEQVRPLARSFISVGFDLINNFWKPTNSAIRNAT